MRTSKLPKKTTGGIALVAMLFMGAAWSTRAMLEIGPVATVTNDFKPQIRFVDTSNFGGAGSSDWSMEAVPSVISSDEDVFQIEVTGSDVFPLRVFAGANNNNFVLDPNGNVAINRPLAQVSNEVEVFGNNDRFDARAAIAVTPLGSASAVFLADSGTSTFEIGARASLGIYTAPIRGNLDTVDDALVIDSEGDVGVGGIAIASMDPFVDLHVADGQVLFDAPGTVGDWRVNPGSVGFFLRNKGSNTAPFQVFNNAPSDSFVINDAGDVGIGTNITDAALHILRDDETASFKVEEASSTVKIRQLFELINNGGVQFALENLDAGERWDFTNNSIGDFLVNRVGTGGPEMTVTRAGRLVSGPGGFAALDSRPNGNLFIKGTLFEVSDRNQKENFEDVDCCEILEKVCELPISTWNYKTDDDAIRHMGPVAQDFRSAFELGDSETTIATTDKVGISLAAIKALNKKLDTKCEEISTKDARISELESDIMQIEDRVHRLEAALNQLLPQ